MKFIIKCHTNQRSYACPHFFLLSKGRNTGKPLIVPCPNCFVVMFNTEEERTHHYWICNALWQSGVFRQHLIGSVVEFMHISDLRHIIRQHAERANSTLEHINQFIVKLNKIEHLEQELVQHLQYVGRLKKEFLWNFLH